jgi:hypothetical protein
MPLTMRPTGLGHGTYKDDPGIPASGQIGRIYERRGFPDHVRWVWSLYGVVLTRPPGIGTEGHAPTFEAAKAKFGASFGRLTAAPHASSAVAPCRK